MASAVAPSPDDPQPLTEEELAERDALLSGGFSNWNRRDFNSFVRACEKVWLSGHQICGSRDQSSGPGMSLTLPPEKIWERGAPCGVLQDAGSWIGDVLHRLARALPGIGFQPDH